RPYDQQHHLLGSGTRAARNGHCARSSYPDAKISSQTPATTPASPTHQPDETSRLITGVSGAMMVFTEAYIMTDGGPDNSTLFYMLYLYRNAFSYGQLGFASALAVLLFLFGMLLAGLIYWLSRRFVNYDVSAG